MLGSFRIIRILSNLRIIVTNWFQGVESIIMFRSINIIWLLRKLRLFRSLMTLKILKTLRILRTLRVLRVLRILKGSSGQ